MLDEFVGQTDSIEQLKIELEVSKLTGRPLPHMLLLGLPGTGKTTLARAISQELDKPFEVLHCPNVAEKQSITEKVLAAAGGILFCEEIHALDRKLAEDLYTVIDDSTINTLVPIMETAQVPAVIEYQDGSVDLDFVEGESPTGRYESRRRAIEPLTIIGATTDEARLPEAFRSRLGGLVIRMEEYTVSDLVAIGVTYAQHAWQMSLRRAAATTIAERCRQNPRRLKQLIDRTASRAISEDLKVMNNRHAVQTLHTLGVDHLGLEAPHRKMLQALTSPVSRTILAQKVGLPVKDADLIFGDLSKLGLVQVERKHEITDKGREALALTAKEYASGEFPFVRYKDEDRQGKAPG